MLPLGLKLIADRHAALLRVLDAEDQRLAAIAEEKAAGPSPLPRELPSRAARSAQDGRKAA